MPEAFLACVRKAKEGKARVARVSGPNKEHGLQSGQYVNYCYDDKGSHRSEVHTKKE